MTKKQINYKVKSGKLLRILVSIEGSIIKDIKRTGDFFIYPEEAIFEIEKGLKDSKIENVKEILDRIIKSKKIEIIGFSPEDLANALKSFENNS